MTDQAELARSELALWVAKAAIPKLLAPPSPTQPLLGDAIVVSYDVEASRITLDEARTEIPGDDDPVAQGPSSGSGGDIVVDAVAAELTESGRQYVLARTPAIEPQGTGRPEALTGSGPASAKADGQELLHTVLTEALPQVARDAAMLIRAYFSPERNAWRDDGRFGIEWAGGAAEVGRVRERHGTSVVRDLHLFDDREPPVNRAVSVSLKLYQTPHDLPSDQTAYDCQNVIVPSDADPGLPAWRVDGTDSARHNWAIFVHGLHGTRREGLRTAATLAQLGMTCLFITYRNDPESPHGETGRYEAGVTEWHDLAAAVTYALQAGAERIVLAGYSMGGGIVESYLLETEELPRAVLDGGVLLEAPLLDYEATIRWLLADKLPLSPEQFEELKEHLTNVSGVNWEKLKYRDRLVERTHQGGPLPPILLIHGIDDKTAPIALSQDLADRLNMQQLTVATEDADVPPIPSLTKDLFVRFEDASHVGAWNRNAEAYSAYVAGFFSPLLFPPPAKAPEVRTP